MLVSAKLAHSYFHGIPWNCSCQRNWRAWSSMEFHGTARVIEIGALQVPWNSTELLVSSKLAHPKFDGIPLELLVSAKLAHFKLLGIPWNSVNCLCQRNWHTPSSIEFHGIPWNCSCHGNWHIPSSMKFHGTKFHGIPWNCWCQFHGIPWNLLFFYLMEPLVSSNNEF